jgi:hypothetical protein
MQLLHPLVAEETARNLQVKLRLVLEELSNLGPRLIDAGKLSERYGNDVAGRIGRRSERQRAPAGLDGLLEAARQTKCSREHREAAVAAFLLADDVHRGGRLRAAVRANRARATLARDICAARTNLLAWKLVLASAHARTQAITFALTAVLTAVCAALLRLTFCLDCHDQALSRRWRITNLGGRCKHAPRRQTRRHHQGTGQSDAHE